GPYPDRQVAYDYRLSGQYPRLWQANGGNCCHVELEQDRGMGKIQGLHPLWMQLAQPAYVVPSQHQTRRTARVQRGVSIGNTDQIGSQWPQQHFDVALDIMKIDLSLGDAPLRGTGGTPGCPGNMYGLVHA